MDLIQALLLSFGYPLLLGSLLLMVCCRVFLFRLPIYLLMLLSYVLGMLIIPLYLICLDWLGISFDFLSVLSGLMLLVVCLVCLVYAQRSAREKMTMLMDIKQPGFSRVVMLLIMGYVVLHVVILMLTVISIPIYAYDAWSISMLKGKIIFYDQSLMSYPYFEYRTYPLHTPLLSTWISICFGYWNEQYIKLLFPFYFFATATLQYYVFNRLFSKKAAIAGTFLLFSAELVVFHAGIAYRDILMQHYIYGSVLWLLMWLRYQKNFFLFFAIFYACCTPLMKIEGALYMLILLAFIFIQVIKDKQDDIKRSLLYFFISVMPLCLTTAFKFHYDIQFTKRMTFVFPVEGVWPRIMLFFQRIVEYFLLSPQYGWIPFFVALTFILCLCQQRWHVGGNKAAQIFLLLFGSIFFMSTFTANHNEIITPYSFSRLMLHFIPLLIPFVIANSVKALERL